MIINGKVHLFFEQSGTFKNEFIKLGIPAEDYDIQDNFGQTDHVVDLFDQIEREYDKTRQDKTRQDKTIFDDITKDDLIMAFFPCIYFCDNNTMYFEDTSFGFDEMFNGKTFERYKYIIERNDKRNKFYKILWQLVAIVTKFELKLIIENPWNLNNLGYLQRNFIKPSIIDKNRLLRGDFFKKPTAYWFINAEPTNGFTLQYNKVQKIVNQAKAAKNAGLCSEERSMISPDYARNFICDFILGKKQNIGQLSLF